jgi:hypothetical protein
MKDSQNRKTKMIKKSIIPLSPRSPARSMNRKPQIIEMICINAANWKLSNLVL